LGNVGFGYLGLTTFNEGAPLWGGKC